MAAFFSALSCNVNNVFVGKNASVAQKRVHLSFPITRSLEELLDS